VIVVEVAAVRFPEVKRSVNVPLPVMLRPLKAATPEGLVVAVSVPFNVPEPDTIWSETLTTMPLWLTLELEASRSLALGCCANAVPLVPLLDGC
jgi:hypothetical protein